MSLLRDDSDVLKEWLLAVHTRVETPARAAAELNPPPWKAEGGLVHGGMPAARHPHRMETESSLWDNEGADTLSMHPTVAEHVAQHDPAAVIARIQAERTLLAPRCPWHITYALVAWGWRHEPGWCDAWTPQLWLSAE